MQSPAEANIASGDPGSGGERSAFYRPGDGDAPPSNDNYSVSEHSPPHCTVHICVHWVDSSEDAPDLSDSDEDGVPDAVERTTDRFEAAWNREIAPPPSGLGWRPPKGDGKLGGGIDKTDVYLENLHGSALGVARGDPGSAADGSGSGSAYVLLERSLADSGREAALTDISPHTNSATSCRSPTTRSRVGG